MGSYREIAMVAVGAVGVGERFGDQRLELHGLCAFAEGAALTCRRWWNQQLAYPETSSMNGCLGRAGRGRREGPSLAGGSAAAVSGNAAPEDAMMRPWRPSTV